MSAAGDNMLAVNRTQVQLTDEQLRRVKAVAAARGVSMAEVIREAVDALTSEGREARHVRAMRAVGRFRSGHSDVAEHHDDHLTDAFSG